MIIQTGKGKGPFRAAAVDIDGTLKGGETISQANIQAVRALKEAGLVVFPATGRIFQQTKPYYRLGELNGPMVTSDGAVVRSSSGRKLAKRAIPRQAAAGIRALGSEFDVTTISHLHKSACVTTRNHWNRDADRHLQELGDKLMFETHRSVRRMETFFIDQSAPQVILDQYEQEVRSRFSPAEVNISRYGPESLHFKAPGVTKVHGLERVAEMHGWDQSQFVCFGDSRNDVEMLKWAGLGIAMFHGREIAKASADLVVASPSADVDFAAAVEAFLKLYRCDLASR